MTRRARLYPRVRQTDPRVVYPSQWIWLGHHFFQQLDARAGRMGAARRMGRRGKPRRLNLFCVGPKIACLEPTTQILTSVLLLTLSLRSYVLKEKGNRQIKWPKKGASQEQEAWGRSGRRLRLFSSANWVVGGPFFAPFVLFRTGKGRTSSFWEAFAEAKKPNADKAITLVLFHGHIFGWSRSLSPMMNYRAAKSH